MMPVEGLRPDAIFVQPVNVDFLGDDRGSWGLPVPDFETWDFAQCDSYLRTFGQSLRLTLLSLLSSDDLRKLALGHGADTTLLDRLTRDGLLGYTAGVVTDEEVKRVGSWRDEALSLLGVTVRAMSPDDEKAYRLPGIDHKTDALQALRRLVSDNIPVGVVELMDRNFYLVLCREVPHRNRAIAEAFIALGYLPPISCCELEPDTGEADTRTTAACYRTCRLVREHCNKLLHRLEEVREQA